MWGQNAFGIRRLVEVDIDGLHPLPASAHTFGVMMHVLSRCDNVDIYILQETMTMTDDEGLRHGTAEQ